jgi:hypothetical protein
MQPTKDSDHSKLFAYILALGVGVLAGVLITRAPGLQPATPKAVEPIRAANQVYIAPPVQAPFVPAKPGTKGADPRIAKNQIPIPPMNRITPIPPTAIGIEPMRANPWGAKLPEKVDENPSVRLMDMSLPEELGQKARDIARANQGRVVEIKIYAGDKHAERAGLLITCPKAQTDPLIKLLENIGGSENRDWRGTSAERADRLSEPIYAALADFRQKRQELLARYYEDAVPVQDLDEKIKEALQALAAYHIREGAQVDAIQINFD